MARSIRGIASASSSSTAAPATSSSSSLPLRSNTAGAGGSWEDEAWALDSDDEDFVARQGRPAGARLATKSRTSAASGATTATTQAGSSSSRSGSRESSAPSGARHAPPARPHPYPIPASSAASHHHGGSYGSASGSAVMTGSPTASYSANTASGLAPGSMGSTRSWTLVDDDGTAAAAAKQGGAGAAEQGFAGSPPTDVGGNALEAVQGAAMTGMEHKHNGGQAAAALNRRRSSDVQGEVGAHGRAKKPPGEKEAETMRGYIRSDVMNVVEDPTAMLASLSLDWATSTSAYPSSPSLVSTPVKANSLPPSALSGASFAETVGSPLSPTTSKPLPRDSSSADPSSTPTRPGSARKAATAASSSSKRRMDFDTVLMGGDGIIASGGFNASRTSLVSEGGEDEGDSSLAGAGSSDVPSVSSSTMMERKRSTRTIRKRERFLRCLEAETVKMDELRALAWAGVPKELRPMVWQLLLGYLPPSKAHRSATLARKRADYASAVRLTFQRGTENLDQGVWHQIKIDVPRTNPGIALWQREGTQRALERILYVWASRHPASGYVQGINDLATPFFEVFLSAYISEDPEQYDVALLPAQALEALEADTYWCLSKLLDGIQDNYTFAQPGIQRQVRRMAELVARINPPLHAHLQDQGVEYIQFAFRWMNCLLMRELSVQNIVRMWDTYLAEGPDAFSDFHLYVCAVFLSKWAEPLLGMDFQGIIMFLQSLPTKDWSDKDAEMLLSDAFVKKSWFCGTAHISA